MAIRKIGEFVEATSPQNSDKLLLERNGSGKSITVGNLLSDLNNRTRINYLRPVLKTTTKNGVTCTNNEDGTFTLNGTSNSSERTIFWVTQDNSLFYLKTGQYKVVGTPSNTSAFIGGSGIDYADYSGTIIDHTEGTALSLGIVVPPNYSANNELFKPMITDDLSATYDDFVSYNNSFVTGINSGINIDLLWENASPTSSFNPQTLSFDINLEKYKYIGIVCRYLNTADIKGVSFIKPGDGYFSLHIARSENYWRYQVRCYSNNIEFGDGLINNDVNQNACIPMQIYGVK